MCWLVSPYWKTLSINDPRLKFKKVFNEDNLNFTRKVERSPQIIHI